MLSYRCGDNGDDWTECFDANMSSEFMASNSFVGVSLRAVYIVHRSVFGIDVVRDLVKGPVSPSVGHPVTCVCVGWGGHLHIRLFSFVMASCA